jgi:hypothetical protein
MVQVPQGGISVQQVEGAGGAMMSCNSDDNHNNHGNNA